MGSFARYRFFFFSFQERKNEIPYVVCVCGDGSDNIGAGRVEKLWFQEE